MKKYTGTVYQAFKAGFFWRRTPYLVARKMMAANAADRKGAMIQARKTWTTPELMFPPHQITPSAPTRATPIPMTPPMMEWVVETGRPIRVAKVRYSEEPTRAQVIPSISNAPLSPSKREVSTTLVRMVSATVAPTPILLESAGQLYKDKTQ